MWLAAPGLAILYSWSTNGISQRVSFAVSIAVELLSVICS
jgi:hypothetical protein